MARTRKNQKEAALFFEVEIYQRLQAWAKAKQQPLATMLGDIVKSWLEEQGEAPPPPVTISAEEYERLQRLAALAEEQHQERAKQALIEPPTPSPAPLPPRTKGETIAEIEERLTAKCREMGIDPRCPPTWKGSVIEYLEKKILEAARNKQSSSN